MASSLNVHLCFVLIQRAGPRFELLDGLLKQRPAGGGRFRRPQLTDRPSACDYSKNTAQETQPTEDAGGVIKQEWVVFVHGWRLGFLGEQYLLVGSHRDISDGVDSSKKVDFCCYGNQFFLCSVYISCFLRFP